MESGVDPIIESYTETIVNALFESEKEALTTEERKALVRGGLLAFFGIAQRLLLLAKER